MAEKIFSGGAIATAQVNTETPVVANIGDTFTVKIENYVGVTNSITYTAVAATVKDVVEGLKALADAAKTGGAAPWDEVTCTEEDTKLTITSDTTGRPLTITASATGAGASLTDASVTASSGPNIITLAENFEGDVALVADDSFVVPGDIADGIYGHDLSGTTLVGFEVKGNSIAIGARKKPLHIDLELVAGGTYYDAELAGTGITFLQIDDYNEINISAAAASPGAGQYGLNLTGTLEAAGCGGTININCESNQSIGVGANAGDDMQVAQINLNGGELTIGEDVTEHDDATAPDVTMRGGTLTNNAPLGTAKQYAGTFNHDDGAIAALRVYKGQNNYSSDGTLTQGYVYNGGVLDFSKGTKAVTVTDLTVYEGATVKDPQGRVTWTNPVEFPDGVENVTLDIGKSRKLTVADL